MIKTVKHKEIFSSLASGMSSRKLEASGFKLYQIAEIVPADPDSYPHAVPDERGFQFNAKRTLTSKTKYTKSSCHWKWFLSEKEYSPVILAHILAQPTTNCNIFGFLTETVSRNGLEFFSGLWFQLIFRSCLLFPINEKFGSLGCGAKFLPKRNALSINKNIAITCRSLKYNDWTNTSWTLKNAHSTTLQVHKTNF